MVDLALHDTPSSTLDPPTPTKHRSTKRKSNVLDNSVTVGEFIVSPSHRDRIEIINNRPMLRVPKRPRLTRPTQPASPSSQGSPPSPLAGRGPGSGSRPESMNITSSMENPPIFRGRPRSLAPPPLARTESRSSSVVVELDEDDEDEDEDEDVDEYISDEDIEAPPTFFTTRRLHSPGLGPRFIEPIHSGE